MGEGRTAARLLRLASELRDELAVLQSVAAAAREAAQGDPADPAHVALLALRLHRYYTALENIVQRIERTLGSEPSGGDWHLELLLGAAREIAGVRPAILPQVVIAPLREVLRFRHFFRHAYAVELDAGKLRVIAGAVEQVAPHVDAALTAFVSFLRDAAAALEVP